MANDYQEAKDYINRFFGDQERIVNQLATVNRDAIDNFDRVSEIPAESSAWNWGVFLELLKTTLSLAVKTIPQLKGVAMVYEATMAQGGKAAVEWVEKTAKKAKDLGVDPAKLITKEPPKPPSVKDLKETAVKALEGVQTWQLKTVEYLVNLRNHYTDHILPTMASKGAGRLRQAMEEALGPIPEFNADKIKAFGVMIELSLYERVYSKGASIYVTSPNRGKGSIEEVRGVPVVILERVKYLTKASSDAQAVASWNLTRKYEACNGCHSPSRMRPSPSRWGRDGSDWVIGTGGGGQGKRYTLKPLNPDGSEDTRQLADWLQRSSR